MDAMLAWNAVLVCFWSHCGGHGWDGSFLACAGSPTGNVQNEAKCYGWLRGVEVLGCEDRPILSVDCVYTSL